MSTVPLDIGVITGVIVEVARAMLDSERPQDVPSASTQLPDFVTERWVLRLIERARLQPVDVAILRILLAAEIEPVAYRMLLRLASDPTEPGVAIDALMVLMRAFGATTVDVLHALRPTSPLVERGLVQIHGDEETPTIVRRLTLPQRLVDHVIDGRPPAALDRPLLLIEPALDVESLCPVPARDDRDRLPVVPRLRHALRGVLDGDPVWVTGPPGIGRKTALAALVQELGCRLLVLACEEAIGLPASRLVPTLWREVLLGDAVLCVADADARLASREVRGEDDTPQRASSNALSALYGVLRRASLPVVFTSDQPPSVQELDRPPQLVRFGAPSPADTLALWHAKLPGAEAIEETSTRFRLTPGRIVRAATAARQIAEANGRTAVQHRDVAQAISVSIAQHVAVLGNLVEDSQTWNDVVLPDDALDSVRELIARVRYRHAVLDEWGFRRKLSKGLGLAALFSGPPGTGKTMVASLIARELGQELYQIDMSRVISKWMGETEKNLARVFDAAEGANVLLLFDEADSLFSKRTEVKSSHDRHSNAEVNYLLQRVERFEGICILTTNFEGSIDTAFKRRLAFRMIFPLPDEHERAELWRRMIPKSANVAGDVDYEELGSAYELAGGNIRNAVLRAAFLAASEQRAIDRELLLRAVRLEYRDAGKFTTAGRIN